jgi:hypothetical protein
MDVRAIIISEFRSTLERRGYQVTQRLLEIAESPFNLSSVQSAVDNDIQERTRRILFESERRRTVTRLEQGHEEQLRKLSRQYALQLIDASRRGYEITASRALNEQRTLKAEAGRGCDVYPCEQQQLRGR